MFGQPVAGDQNTRYKLAKMQAEVQVARVFDDKCTELRIGGPGQAGYPSPPTWPSTGAAICSARSWTNASSFGGYGYMWEHPITRAYADAA